MDAPLLTRTGDVVVGYMVSYECASLGNAYCWNTKQASSVTGLTVNLPKLREVNKFGIGTGLDPFIFTSKAVETGLIEDNILTRAHEIAADSVTKITSLVMENLSIVHHMLIFEYTQMTSATQFVAAMGSLLEFAPKTSIVGNVGAGIAFIRKHNIIRFVISGEIVCLPSAGL